MFIIIFDKHCFKFTNINVINAQNILLLCGCTRCLDGIETGVFLVFSLDKPESVIHDTPLVLPLLAVFNDWLLSSLDTVWAAAVLSYVI